MSRLKNKIVLAGLVLSAALLLWLAIHGAGLMIQGRMQRLLARHGIGEAMITSYGQGSGGQIVFSDIKLDPDGFSTIDSITARLRWSFLFSEKPFSEVIVDRLALTGEIGADGKITLAGVNPAALLVPLAETDSLIMNAGEADLLTPMGALRFEMKYRMTRQSDDIQRIEAAIWSKQYQMEMDTRWTGRITPDNKWTVSFDLREARLNLKHFNLSRGSGWLTVDGTFQGFSSIAGQIAAGQMRIGDKSAFNDINLTVEGPYSTSHIILQAGVSAYKDMLITADLRRDHEQWQVKASVEARRMEDLLAFLHNLHDDLQAAAPHSSALTTLLLTPGNLDRVRAAARSVTYDSAELLIDGTSGNLTGRIVLRWNGSAETAVISMNPGAP